MAGGSSSGIGRATAALLHARGAQVIVSARNAQALQAFVDEHPAAWPCRWTRPTPPRSRPLRGRCWRAARWGLVCCCRATTATCETTDFDLTEALRREDVNTGALRVLASVLPP